MMRVVAMLLVLVLLGHREARAQDVFHSSFEQTIGKGILLADFPSTSISSIVDLGLGEGFLEIHASKSETGEPTEVIGLRLVSRNNSDLVLLLDSQGRPVQGVSNVEMRKVLLTDYTADTVTLHFEAPDGSRTTVTDVAFEDASGGDGGQLARSGRALLIFGSAITAADSVLARSASGEKWISLAGKVTLAILGLATLVGFAVIQLQPELGNIASGQACQPLEPAAQCIQRNITSIFPKWAQVPLLNCAPAQQKGVADSPTCRLSPSYDAMSHLLSLTSDSPGCEVTTDETYSYYGDDDIPKSGIDCFDNRFGEARFNYFGTRTRASDGAKFLMFIRPTPAVTWRYLNSGIVGGDQDEAEVKLTDTASGHETRGYFNLAYGNGLSFFSQRFDDNTANPYSIDYTCFSSTYDIWNNNGRIEGTAACPISIPLFPSAFDDPFDGFWSAPALRCVESAADLAPSC
jgi:hypothetical protein